jgi:hypothetical protein
MDIPGRKLEQTAQRTRGVGNRMVCRTGVRPARPVSGTWFHPGFLRTTICVTAYLVRYQVVTDMLVLPQSGCTGSPAASAVARNRWS